MDLLGGSEDEQVVQRFLLEPHRLAIVSASHASTE